MENLSQMPGTRSKPWFVCYFPHNYEASRSKCLTNITYMYMHTWEKWWSIYVTRHFPLEFSDACGWRQCPTGPRCNQMWRSRNKFDAKLLMYREIWNTQLRRAKQTLTAISRGKIKQFLNLPIILQQGILICLNRQKKNINNSLFSITRVFQAFSFKLGTHKTSV